MNSPQFIFRVQPTEKARLIHLCGTLKASKAALIRSLINAPDDVVKQLWEGYKDPVTRSPKKTRHDSSLAATIMTGPTN